MNHIVKIKKSLYNHAAAMFMQNNPERGAYLTENPPGQAYFFTKYAGYVVLHEARPGVFHVYGAFRNKATSGFAEAIVRWCEALGAVEIKLDCFLPAAQAWADAGLNTYALVPFSKALAPATWRDEYGNPSVVYMRKYCVS